MGFVLEIKTKGSKMVFKLAPSEETKTASAAGDGHAHLRAWSTMLQRIFKMHHDAETTNFVVDLRGAPI
tara:strand:+ start:110 stop:316 length:207 start_codon:yes stop_codon:yes gene_type:complete